MNAALKYKNLPRLPQSPDTSDFRARAIVLDAALLATPEAQANRIETEMIKRMRINTPWLLPNLTVIQ